MIGAVLGRVDTTPFFTGVTSLTADLPPETIALNGHIYGLDLKQTRWSSQETLRDGAVVSGEADDSLFNANGAWARYRRSWQYGAGQAIADFSKLSNEFRFETSVGIDPWTEDRITLLRDVASPRSLASANNILCVNNAHLYVSDGVTLYYTTDLITWTAATAPGGTIQSMSSDGFTLYVATSTVTVKYLSSAPGTPVAFGTAVSGNCTLIAFVANRLLLAKDNVLYEVAAAGTLTTIRTHFQATFKWTTVFAVGSKIYFGGYAGARSELYTATVDSNTGNLVQSGEAAPLPAGELLYNAGSYAGVVLLCTNKGVRQATVGGDSTLTYGPLITAPGGVKGGCFDGRFAWVTGEVHPSGGRGLWRLALDKSVDTLQPAYASDVYQTANVAGEVTSVARFLSRTIYACSAVGVYCESTTAYLTDGSIWSGELYFGTVEDKALTELKAIVAPLTIGQSVTGYAYSGLGTQLGTAQVSAISEEELLLDLDGAKVRHCEVQMRLRGNGTTTPTVFSWRLRAYPVPPATLQWILPLRVFERNTINDGMGQEQSMDVLEEAERIVAWQTERESITLQIGKRAYRVRVDAFELQPAKWDDAGSFFQNILVVRLVSA